ncbi:MAG: GTP cyclohydrolase II RibA [Pseudomonadota bacterium]
MASTAARREQPLDDSPLPRESQAPWTPVLGRPERLLVERAVNELRAARPVLLRGPETAVLVMAAEVSDSAHLDALRSSGADLTLVLAAPRLRTLGRKSQTAQRFTVTAASLEEIQRLTAARAPVALPPSRPATPLDQAAVTLVKLSQQLPAALLVTPKAKALPPDLLQVPQAAVEAYSGHCLADLRIAARAPVPLEAGTDVEFVVFRGGEGLRDQVAVLVGQQTATAEPRLLRLHSACLTGDLFGSLKCDCGQQLRDAVAAMMEAGGGILLYLDQEGRGTGLRSKMRAYHLQSDGYDTLESDALLGYEADERNYALAARMLTLLDVDKVTMMTNNPDKIQALTAAGIAVTGRQALIGEVNEHNENYLRTKATSAGHLLDAEPLRRRPRF